MAKITTQFSLTFAQAVGDTIKGTISETITQVGTKAIGNIQSVGTSSEAITLGDVTGSKYVMFKNTDAAHTVYIDTANPATTGATIKLGPGQGVFFPTTVDLFYGLAITGACDVEVIAVQQ